MSGHHISSNRILLNVAGALFILTVLTVAVYFIHIPAPWNIVVAMGIAIFKAALVALFFMNLWWDEKFNSLILVFSVLFFGLLVGLTLIDTLFRSEVLPGF